MKKIASPKLKLYRETLLLLDQSQIKAIGGVPRTAETCATTRASACDSYCTCTSKFC